MNLFYLPLLVFSQIQSNQDKDDQKQLGVGEEPLVKYAAVGFPKLKQNIK